MLVLDAPRLRFVLESTETVLERIAAMSPAERAQVSPEWLERMRAAAPGPWTHGFAMVERSTGEQVGACAYVGPPSDEGVVEIAYSVDPAYRGLGYAKEATAALIDYAHAAGARVVCVHTLTEMGASARVLTASGFQRIGEVVHPEDGLVWRWELVVDHVADADQDPRRQGG